MFVDFFPDAIGIYEDNGDELVYWTEDEWREDSQVVFSIGNAVLMSQTDPDELRRLLMDKNEGRN